MLEIVALIVAVVVLAVVVAFGERERTRRRGYKRRRAHRPVVRYTPADQDVIQHNLALLKSNEDMAILLAESREISRELHLRRVVNDEQVTIIHNLRRELAGSRLAHSASVGVQHQLAAALISLEEGFTPLAAADRPSYAWLWSSTREAFAAVDYVLEHREDYRVKGE